jgi:hypothetical protein
MYSAFMVMGARIRFIMRNKLIDMVREILAIERETGSEGELNDISNFRSPF